MEPESKHYQKSVKNQRDKLKNRLRHRIANLKFWGLEIIIWGFLLFFSLLAFCCQKSLLLVEILYIPDIISIASHEMLCYVLCIQYIGCFICQDYPCIWHVVHLVFDKSCVLLINSTVLGVLCLVTAHNNRYSMWKVLCLH